MNDFKLAIRRLLATPVFTIFSIATLALGIGVTTAAYTAIYVLAARPLGIRDESRIVYVTRSNSFSATAPAQLSWPDYLDLGKQPRSFAAPIAWATVHGTLAGHISSEVAAIEAVSGNYFGTLGVTAALGRLIQPGDDRPDAAGVIVLSEMTWRQQFAADPAVIGTTVRLAKQPLQIVGVAPPGFRGIHNVIVGSRAGWVPLAHAARLNAVRAAFDPAARGRDWLFVAARLHDATLIETANIEVSTLARTLDDTAPLPRRSIGDGPARQEVESRRAWQATPLRERTSLMTGEAMRLVVALPFLVLLVACTNIANLVFSRGASRRQEFAVRASLGASRWRLIREGLQETAIIAVAGGLLGAFVAHGLLTWAVMVLREPIEAIEPGFPLEWRPEPVVFIATAAAALLSLVVAGLVPAMRLSQVSVGRSLTAGAGVAAPPRWRGRSNLIALQVSISAALFLIAVVCVRFAVVGRGGTIEPMTDPHQLAIGVVPLDPALYEPTAVEMRVGAILADLERMPWVTAVAASSDLPFQATPFFNWRSAVEVAAEGQPFGDPTHSDSRIRAIAATSSFARTMNLELIAGRFLDSGTQNEVVLDEHAARIAFGETRVVGRRLLLRSRYWTAVPAGAVRPATVVGVVAANTTVAKGAAFAYLPLSLRDSRSALIVTARTNSPDASGLVSDLRTVVRRVDPDLAMWAAGRGDVIVGVRSIVLRFVALALGSLAVLALVLAMAGLYGVLSHVVERRRREMGVRIALGADRNGILNLVLRQGLRPVVEGVFIGLSVALVVRQLLQLSISARLSAIDAATFGLAAVPLIVAGGLACYVPARRASRVDPNVVLRDA